MDEKWSNEWMRNKLMNWWGMKLWMDEKWSNEWMRNELMKEWGMH